jgi:hypothetical protein
MSEVGNEFYNVINEGTNVVCCLDCLYNAAALLLRQQKNGQAFQVLALFHLLTELQITAQL